MKLMLYSCILMYCHPVSHVTQRVVDGIYDAPEPPDQPLDGLDPRFQQQPGAHQAQEIFQNMVELGVLLLCHLRPILALALLAEETPLEGRKAVVEKAELLKALGTYGVEAVEILRRSDARLEDQRMCMRRLLSLEIQGIGGLGGDLGQLGSEGSGHDGGVRGVRTGPGRCGRCF